MKRSLIVTAALSLAMGLFQGQASAGTTVQNGDGTAFVVLSPVESKELIETRKGLQLVDVRTEQEFYGGALPGSRLVTYTSWSPRTFLEKMQALDMHRPVLLVCAVGGRSFAAAGLLSKNGFKEVYNLDNGLQAWVQQRVPLPAGMAAAAR
jgi:rhodanese-related sulfurtransferase